MVELAWMYQGSMIHKESYSSEEAWWSISRWNLCFWNPVYRDCGPKSCTTYVPSSSSYHVVPILSAMKQGPWLNVVRVPMWSSRVFCFLECWFNGPANGLFVIRMVSCLVASLPPFPPTDNQISGHLSELAVSLASQCRTHCEGEWQDAYLHNLWSRELRGRAARPWLSPWTLYEPQRMFIRYSTVAVQSKMQSLSCFRWPWGLMLVNMPLPLTYSQF